jgi:MFS family permease
MHVRYPIGLQAVMRPGATAFATMFTLESFARSLLSTVIALQALALLHDPRDVSVLFTTVGVTGLAASFLIPHLIHRVGRRRCYTLGAALLIGAAAALASITLAGQTAGMLMRVFGTACLNIATSLYILQYISRHELTLSEPRRLQYSAVAWTVGPALGVVLYQAAGPAWPFAASAAMSVLLLAYFWLLRLRDHPVVRAGGVRVPPRPVHSVGRFVAQPRLRLAWVIAFARSSWWTFFFIYAPLYAVTSGHGPVAGALLVSAGNAVLFLTPAFGRRARQSGIRSVIRAGFATAGLATIAAGVLFDSAAAGAAMLLLGSVGCAALDAVGNIPFLRSVRAFERTEMTTVFRTYHDLSELVTPALFALLLTFFDLRIAFIAQGALMLAAMTMVRHLPPRLGQVRAVEASLPA